MMNRMLSRLAVALCLLAPLCLAELRLATFRADATPAPGEPLIWVKPAAQVLDPLYAKGIVLDDGRARYVLCTLDWCGLGGAAHQLFRNRIARAAGTDPSRVVVQTVHQHTAPYVDGDGYALLETLPAPPLRMSDASLERLAGRIAAAVADSVRRMQPFDSVATSSARVEQVASQRRMFRDGKIVTRYSGAGKDPAMAALPEGLIDPELRTVTLARGARPLARIHFYATHPQTFCCDGRVTADFAGAARESAEPGVFTLYFTGAAGNVTVGKYNDGSDAARTALAARLQAAMRASAAAARPAPAGKLVWRTAQIDLPKKPAPELKGLTGDAAVRAANAAAFASRKRPLDAASLAIGGAAMLFLPGEPFLEYQKYAQSLGKFVAVAGYGDIGPGYLCTDRAHDEGGYEPSASHAAPGTEARLKEAIRKLLGREAPDGGIE
jgi:hypothetical protein